MSEKNWIEKSVEALERRQEDLLKRVGTVERLLWAAVAVAAIFGIGGAFGYQAFKAVDDKITETAKKAEDLESSIQDLLTVRNEIVAARGRLITELKLEADRQLDRIKAAETSERTQEASAVSQETLKSISEQIAKNEPFVNRLVEALGPATIELEESKALSLVPTSPELTLADADQGRQELDLGDARNRFCFLTKIAFMEIDNDKELAVCEVLETGGRWELRTGLTDRRNASIYCSARCIVWD